MRFYSKTVRDTLKIVGIADSFAIFLHQMPDPVGHDITVGHDMTNLVYVIALSA